MKKVSEPTNYALSTLAVGVYSPHNPIKDFKSYLEEFYQLIESSGREYHYDIVIKLRSIDPAFFFTKGKLQELGKFCDENDIELVIVSDPLSVKQKRNLERFLNCDVIDRTGLILDIFERNAITAEGKKQVALARLEYEKAQLAGKGIAMSQQAGRTAAKGGATRGPGETQKEKDIRYLEQLISKIKKDLNQLEKTRETQRKSRLKSKLPLLCLIGYTNAGKSTILNALTKSDVLSEDKLFATLDVSTRELYFDGKKSALLEDTVGFIQQLPHKLIEAFKSTLKELEYADLLIQVIDISNFNWQDHIFVVKDVLEGLEIDKPMLYVFNKADKVENLEKLKPLLSRYEPHVVVSALESGNLQPLINFLKKYLKI